MPDWGFPNFDSRLDEPDPGPEDPAHIRVWRKDAVAKAKRCAQFVPDAHTNEWCQCGGPKYAHSILAVAKGAA